MSNFKFCPECGFKFDKEYKFCPECGYKLGGETKEKPLFDFSDDTQDYDDYKGFADMVKVKQTKSTEIAEELKHAKVLCIRGEFDEAETLVREYIDKHYDQVDGYIAMLRVHSKDFSEFEGDQIEKDINIVVKIGEGNINNADFDNYIKARESYFADKKQAEKENKKKMEENLKQEAEKETKKKEDATLYTQDKEILEKALDLYKNQKYKDAFELFQSIAEHDNPVALYYLGRMYHWGQAVKGDTRKAMEYYEKSANAGYTPAMCSVAYFHHPPYSFNADDHKKTVYWYQKAAELNDPEGQCEIGKILVRGNYGVTTDVNKAIYWFEKSAAQGNRSAVEELKELKNKGNEAAAEALQKIKAKSNKKI